MEGRKYREVKTFFGHNSSNCGCLVTLSRFEQSLKELNAVVQLIKLQEKNIVLCCLLKW